MIKKRNSGIDFRHPGAIDIEFQFDLGLFGISIQSCDAWFSHELFDLKVRAKGDIEVDYHHTVEDAGIVLGQAVKEAIGEKRGICRYGFFLLPMDESLARVALDLSNRQAFVYNVDYKDAMVRDFSIGLVKEFFQAFANAAGCNLHVNLEYGEEPHHIAEAIFKCFARALDRATTYDPRLGDALPSTKGTLSA